MSEKEIKGEIRIEARVRNNILWHAIFDKWQSVADFCQTHKLHQSEVGRLLNLTLAPLRKDGEFRKICQDLSKIFQTLPEELFPQKLYGLEKVKAVVELPLRALSSPKNISLLPEPATPFETTVQVELKREISKALNTLTERERTVLEEHFFQDKTQDEVGQKLSISKPRVSQIEIRALRKLRHPSRGKTLRSFVE